MTCEWFNFCLLKITPLMRFADELFYRSHSRQFCLEKLYICRFNGYATNSITN